MNENCERTCIVVPAYDEAKRFVCAELIAYLQRGTPVDFALVNDGSTDTTVEVFNDIARLWQARVTVIDLPHNQGKAEAVRVGVSKAMSDGYRFVGFWDADWATPLASIDQFVDLMSKRDELDIVLGTRLASLGRKIERKPSRHYLGRVVATFAGLVLDLPVYDTQCGAKLIRVSSETKRVFAEGFESGWAFDVELLARYLTLTGRRDGLHELVLDEWTDVAGSKVRAVDFLLTLGHLARIHRRYRLTKLMRRVTSGITSSFNR